MQPTIYLHHYQTSPFAEKVRRALAFKGLTWQSVLQPPIMPKLDLVALTGGYRRIPVMQIGADVICDTPLMFEVLEMIKPEPALYPAAQYGMVRTVEQWADSTLFSTAMAYNFGPAGAAAFFAKMPPEFANAFIEDRKAMRLGAARMHPADATGAYQNYLARIDSMLQHGFVCGASPTAADFAVYNPLWFTRNIPEVAVVFERFKRILPWMDAMKSLGVESIVKSSSEQAINQASQGSSPFFKDASFIDLHGVAQGSQVSIAAESFGPEISVGKLISATPSRYCIERTDERAGTVRVHFPRVGFVLKSLA